MTVVGVPDIVVLEPVDVHVERVIGVEVHVGNENERRAILSTILRILSGLYLIWNLEIYQPVAPTGCFLCLKKYLHSFARHIRRNSRKIFFSSFNPKP